MPHDPHSDTNRQLLDLIDHPAVDPDAPRNPVLTLQVMERVRHAQASARITRTDARPWALGTVLVALVSVAATTAGVVGDGGLAEAAGLFDEQLVLELVVGALIAATALALSWRRLA